MHKVDYINSTGKYCPDSQIKDKHSLHACPTHQSESVDPPAVPQRQVHPSAGNPYPRAQSIIWVIIENFILDLYVSDP